MTIKDDKKLFTEINSPDGGVAQSVYDSSAQSSRALEELRELWRYRNLVLQMVRRDMVMRYKRSVLGIAWALRELVADCRPGNRREAAFLATYLVVLCSSSVHGGASSTTSR